MADGVSRQRQFVAFAGSPYHPITSITPSPFCHPPSPFRALFRSLGWVSRWPATIAAAVCLLLLAVAAYADWWTGPDVQSSLFYFLPIIVASLRFQLPGGLSVALTSAILTHTVN